jgi:hypothetical protein
MTFDTDRVCFRRLRAFHKLVVILIATAVRRAKQWSIIIDLYPVIRSNYLLLHSPADGL